MVPRLRAEASWQLIFSFSDSQFCGCAPPRRTTQRSINSKEGQKGDFPAGQRFSWNFFCNPREWGCGGTMDEWSDGVME